MLKQFCVFLIIFINSHIRLLNSYITRDILVINSKIFLEDAKEYFYVTLPISGNSDDFVIILSFVLLQKVYGIFKHLHNLKKNNSLFFLDGQGHR